MSERAYQELTRGEALGPFGAGAIATHASDAQPTPGMAAIASVLDRQITGVEDQVLALAEAMPESTFSFSPEQLRIPGSDYKGARTFAVQIKHIGASNYA